MRASDDADDHQHDIDRLGLSNTMTVRHHNADLEESHQVMWPL